MHIKIYLCENMTSQKQVRENYNKKQKYSPGGRERYKENNMQMLVDCCLFLFSYSFFLQKKNNMKWKMQYAPAETSLACFMQHTLVKVHSLRIWLWFADLAANIWLVSD